MNILLTAAAGLLILLMLPRASSAKGGGSKTVNAVGPKSRQLTNLENRFYNLSNTMLRAFTSPLSGNADGGIPQPYDADTLVGQLLNDAMSKTYESNARYDDLMGQASNLSAATLDALSRSRGAGDPYFDAAWGNYNDARKTLTQAGTAGDPWYDAARGAYAAAEGMLPGITGNLNYTSESSKWYDDYTRGMLGGARNLLETGQVPQPLIDAMTAAVTSGIDKSVGTSVSDLASRGVLNSSVANRALSDTSKAVTDSMAENYLNAFNSVLGGYNQSAATGADAGRAFADTYLNINNAWGDAMRNAIGLGDSYGKTGSMRVSDLLGVAKGYDDTANSLMGAGSQRINDWLNIAGGHNNALGANVQERDQLLGAIPQYHQNAMAPVMSSYDLLKTMQQDHWNSNKKDTIVKQGK